MNLNLGEVKGSKRFTDLEPDVKKALLFLEKRFLSEKNIIEGNKKHLAEPLPAIAKDMKAAEAKLDFWMEHLERQYESVQEFRATVNKELRSAETAYFLLKKLVSHTYEQTQEALPSDYFWDVSNNFEKRMQECRQKIEELEQYLASARNPRQFSPKMLLDTIDNQHEFFITTTSTLASVHEAVDVLREDFVALQKRIDRNYRGNPFEEAAKFRTDKSLRKVADQKLKKKQAAPALAAWGGTAAGGGAAAGAGATGAGSFGTGTTGAGTSATGGFDFGGGGTTGGWGAGTTTGTGAAPAAAGAGATGGWGASAATTGAAATTTGWGAPAAGGAGATDGFSFGGSTTTSNTTTGATGMGFSFGDTGAKRSGYGDLA